MITFVRTARIALGKTPSALAHAAEVATHLKAAHGVDVEVLRPIGGNPARVAWAVRLPSLAALEDHLQRLAVDKAYGELVRLGAENWLPGSVHDDLWQTV
jgi:hypothetical protein